LNYKIYIQTFQEYAFQNEEDVEILNYDISPEKYPIFWDDFKVSFDNSDVILFTQQDNLYLSPLKETIEHCEKGNVVTIERIKPHTYSILKDDKLVTPRISDVASFVPGDLARDFQEHKLSLGIESNAFAITGELYKKYHAVLEQHDILMKEGAVNLLEVCNRGREEHDIGFEPTVYACCLNVPWSTINVCHLQGGELMCYYEPNVYKHPLMLSKTILQTDRFEFEASACLHLLLSGVYHPCPAAEAIFQQGSPYFRYLLTELNTTAHLWMNDRQLDCLKYAMHCIGRDT
jgi:hypothetical protein